MATRNMKYKAKHIKKRINRKKQDDREAEYRSRRKQGKKIIIYKGCNFK